MFEYDIIVITAREIDEMRAEDINLNEIEKSDYTYVSNARQIALLKKCLEVINDIRGELEMEVPVDLMQINIQLLWETLGEITGQVYKDDLLDEIDDYLMDENTLRGTEHYRIINEFYCDLRDSLKWL